MHSLLAGWRVSLRRTRAEMPIVAAAWLVTLLATILFAAGPIYSSAAALAGLRQTLAEAPATDSSLQVAMYGTQAGVAEVDSLVRSDLQTALAPLRTPIVRDGRASSTLALQAGQGEPTRDRAVVGFLDELPAHVSLVDGAWPVTSPGSGPLQAVLIDAAATTLGLSVGDQLTMLAPRGDEPLPVEVHLVGIFAISDAADPYWYGDAQLTTGVVQSGQERVLGPFLTTPEAVLGNAALGSLHMRWRAFPDFGGLSTDNIGAIRTRLDGLPARFEETTGNPRLASGLPEILSAAERSLLVGRTQMLVVLAQLAIMAGYAIVLTASLLVDHRRVETALLRSRGASPLHIAWLALAEGLLLVVPAVVVAPWLAAAEATLLNVVGPLADIGLSIAPMVTADSYLLAVAAGLVCLALLVLPAFLAARNFASEERELSRQETRPLAQRIGIDLALLALSAVFLWQLRLYGAPLTRTVQGSLGIDPLLVAAPTVGLLAGGILALRILPLLATALESWVSRGREVVASLGSRQLARRPLRYTRTALLLILAVSLGVFALSYGATWSTSQQDQATYQAGADVRTVTASRPGQPPLLRAAYAALPGVNGVLPVERIPGSSGPSGGHADLLLALDADSAASVIHFRSDTSTQPLDEMMRALRDGRPLPELVALPADAAVLRIVPIVEIETILDGQTEAPIDPATLTDVGMTATAVVRDAHGLIYRLAGERVNVIRPGTELTAPLSLPSSPFEGPTELLGLELVLSLPSQTFTTNARIGVAELAVGPGSSGPWAALAVDGWAARVAAGTRLLQPVPDTNLERMLVSIDGTGELFLFGGGVAGRILFTSASLDALDAAVPVIANQAFVTDTGAAPGQTISMAIDGVGRQLSIAGVVDSFPTTDPSETMVIVDGPTLGLLRLQATGATLEPDEWWLAVAPESSADVAAALASEPFDSPEVVSAADRARSLSTDPVALGIIGALLLGFVATGVFALVALVVGATVSARQRRTEFALLRALGLSARQLSGWLWLENGSLVLVSLVAGTLVGILISWVALPFITVTQQAANPVPPVQVHLPWDRILVLDVVMLVALGVAVGILATVLRRIGVGTVLRMGED